MEKLVRPPLLRDNHHTTHILLNQQLSCIGDRAALPAK